MNVILQTLAPLAKIFSAVLGCAEANLVEQPEALIELAVEGEPQPGSFAEMTLKIEVSFNGPAEFAQCVLNSI